MVQPFRGSDAELAGFIQRHIAVFDPWPEATRQLHGTNPLPGHFGEYPTVKAGVVGNVPWAAVVVRDNVFYPGFIRHH